MEISIDEVIMKLSMHKYYALGKDYKAVQTAIDTMRKYQKIVDIVSLNDEEFKQCGLKELKEILEVIADGNK